MAITQHNQPTKQPTTSTQRPLCTKVNTYPSLRTLARGRKVRQGGSTERRTKSREGGREGGGRKVGKGIGTKVRKERDISMI